MKKNVSIINRYYEERGNLLLPNHLKKKIQDYNGKILAADIGGTYTRMAKFQVENGDLHLVDEKTYKTHYYSSFLEVLKIFSSGNMKYLDAICLGVAGPVIEGKVKGTNFSWELDQLE